MRVNFCKMLAVGLGLIASIGVASAQQPAGVPVNYVANAPAAGGCSTCNSCGPTTTASTKSKICDALFIGKGTAMPIGCACAAAQRNFVFGSCNQFYNPGKECKGCGIGHGECRNPVGGAPAAPVPPCVYSSYTQR
jgi:hypothetical protein